MERNSDYRTPGPLNVLLEKLLPQSSSCVVLKTFRSKDENDYE